MQRRLLMLAAATLSAAGPALAQTESTPEGTGSLEEVLVTATRREERLQDVPIAVSVISGEQLADSGFKSLTDIQYTLPGVYFGTTPSDAGFRLRGVGTAGGFSSSSEQSVGLVVDQVVIPFGTPVASLGDLERVEVLKGPQGTQFGKNASSGIVSITTSKPTFDEFKGSLFASYGSLDEYDVHGSVNVPVGKQAAVQLYAFDREYDGYVDNITLNKKWGGTQNTGGRGKLLWQLTDNVSAYLIADYSKSTQQGPGQLWTLNRLPATYDPFFNPPFVDLNALGVTPGFDNDKSIEETDSEVIAKNYGASLELDFGLGDYTLTSLTAWRELKNEPTPFAIDGSSLPRFTAQSYGNKSQFASQELRLTSPGGRAFDYVAGLYASRLKVGVDGGQSAQLRPNPADPGFIISISAGIGNTETTTDSVAAFFDGSLRLTDTLRLLGGVRVTNDDVEATTASIIDPAFPPGPSAAGFVLPYEPISERTASTSDTGYSGRLGLEYKPNDDLLFYGTVAHGYLGPTVTYSILTATQSVVNPQKVDDITIGAKTQFMERRLTLNANVFYDEYTDLQTSVFNGLEFLTQNAGGLKTKGFEIEALFAVTPDFRLNLGYTYADAYFTDYITTCPPSIVIQGPSAVAASCNAPGSTADTPLYQAAGDTPPGAPKNTVTAGATFEVPISSSLVFDSALNYYYRDEVDNTAGDTLSIHPDYQVVNLNLGIGASDSSWRLGVLARNLFDERFHAAILGLPFAQPGGTVNWQTRDGRRTVGVSLEARF
jgi:iron complex outermembrane recepter protein